MARQAEGGTARTVADRRGPPLPRAPLGGRAPAGSGPPRRLLAGLLILTVQGLAGAARGEPAPPRPPAPAEGPGQPGAAAEGASDPALPLIEQAAEDYDRGRFEDAVAQLERAYLLSPRPLILFNKAQVLRKMKACARARDAYDQFIAATPADDPDRERALGWRREMEACAGPPPGSGEPAPAAAPRPTAGAAAVLGPSDKLMAAGSGPAFQPPPPPVVLGAAPVAPPPARAGERGWPIVGWAAIAVATVAGVTAGALAWKASALSSEISAALRVKDRAWGPDLESKQADGLRDARWARWLAVGAGAVGLGGAAVLIWLPSGSPGSGGGQARAPVAGALFGYAGAF